MKNGARLAIVQCNRYVSGGKFLTFELWMTGKYTLAQLKAFRVFGH